MSGHHAIIGAGAVGGVLAARLAAAGEQVTLVVRPSRLEAYQAPERLRLDNAEGRSLIESQPPSISDRVPDTADTVYLAVKHTALDTTLETLKDQLPARATLVSCLNGIGVTDRLRQHFPDHPARQLTIMFNAAMLSPLHYRITTHPGLVLDGPRDALFKTLRQAGFRVARGNEAIARGKLLINLNNALCALTGTSFRDLLLNPDLRVVFMAVVDEAIEAFNAAGLPWRLPMPLPYPLYRLLVRHGGRLPWWLARLNNGLTGAAYPSMVADIHAGRATEIRELNGVISELGRRHNVPTPLNDTVVTLVLALEAGDGEQFSPARLRRRLELDHSSGD